MDRIFPGPKNNKMSTRKFLKIAKNACQLLLRNSTLVPTEFNSIAISVKIDQGSLYVKNFFDPSKTIKSLTV